MAINCLHGDDRGVSSVHTRCSCLVWKPRHRPARRWNLRAYAHLRQGSVVVRPGVRVEVGDKIAEVGNTGNSSVPHLHVQLMDRANPHAAAGLTMLWRDIELSGEIEDALKSLAKSPTGSAVRAMPRNGEIFRIDDP